MELKDQIRIARGALGVSQTELATKLGISKQTIVWWETGEHRPKTGRIRELENVLNVRLDLSERGSATPLSAEAGKKSLSVDPESLRLAVAIGRLPEKQKNAITTLVFIGESHALGASSGSFIETETEPNKNKTETFIEEEGKPDGVHDNKIGATVAKRRIGSRTKKDAG